MDVSKYMAKGFIKPGDVRSGPRQECIVNVYPSERYDCLVLDLESGDQLSLNKKTTSVLAKAYGTESDHWRGHVIELSHGTYKDKDTGEEKETVHVKTISLPEHVGANSKSPTMPENETARAAKPTPTSRDLDDEIPF